MNKLVRQQFPGSEISKKVLHSDRRTKCEFLVKKVLGPKLLNDMLGDLKETARLLQYICFDSSNRQNRKLFPIVGLLTYFAQW